MNKKINSKDGMHFSNTDLEKIYHRTKKDFIKMFSDIIISQNNIHDLGHHVCPTKKDYN